MSGSRRRGSAGFLRIIALVVMALCAISCAKAVPEIRGRVIDAETGEPIVGAEVGRLLMFKQVSLHGGGPRPDFETLVRTHTDNDGRFVLPAARERFVSYPAWYVFKPGWMEAHGCWIPGQNGGGCIGWGNNTRYDQPWAAAESTFEDGVVLYEIALYRPDCTNIPGLGTEDPKDNSPTWERNQEDAWPEYFDRIYVMVVREILTWETLLDEAVAYVTDGGKLSDNVGMAFNLERLVPTARSMSPRWEDERVLILARAFVDFCTENPEGVYCSRRVSYIDGLRDRLNGDEFESRGDD